MISEILASKLALSMIFGFLFAQFIKFSIEFVHSKRLVWHKFVENGGFPSAHVSGMSAVCSGIYFEQGVSSLFIVIIALLIIVFRDAVGVRKSAGRHGEAINKIAKKLKMKLQVLEEVVGHTFFEATGGFLVGVGVAAIIYAL